MKIKKGDTVQILRGKDAAKSGKVLRVDAKAGTVIVEGLNMWKRHRRPRKQGEKGEIISLSRPLPIAAVGIVCPHCGHAARVGFRVSGEGEHLTKVRVCKSCDAAI